MASKTGIPAKEEPQRAILLASCRDQKGVVAALSQFIYEQNGNITDADQHRDPEADIFCTRIEWDLAGFKLERPEIASTFRPLAESLGLRWSIHFSDQKPRISIWVSRQEHCLLDLLGRIRSGDLRAELGLILSNHRELGATAAQFGIPFAHLPYHCRK